MNALWVLLAVAAGIAMALVLNKLMADKIENKTHRIALKTTAYIVCSILAMAFVAAGSLRIILDAFIEDRIAFIGVKFLELAPHSNILETPVDKRKRRGVNHLFRSPG
jgi:hypothetical protein